MKRSKTHGVVYRKTISERHYTLPFDGVPKLVVTTKYCPCCDSHLPLAHFYLKSEFPGDERLRNQCVECWDEHNGRNHEKTPDASASLVALF